jgi:hypothetical protein
MDQLDAVCPIFCEREDERLFQVGSGALIEFRGYFFLLTAAHVIDELKDADLLVPHANNVIKSIEGACSYISPSVNRAETNFTQCGLESLQKYLTITKTASPTPAG